MKMTCLMLLLAVAKAEYRYDFGELVREDQPKGEPSWFLLGDAKDGKRQQWMLGLPTKKRVVDPNKPPDKIAPIDPTVAEFCKKNVKKRIMVKSLAGYIGIGPLKGLLVVELHGPIPRNMSDAEFRKKVEKK